MSALRIMSFLPRVEITAPPILRPGIPSFAGNDLQAEILPDELKSFARDAMDDFRAGGQLLCPAHIIELAAGQTCFAKENIRAIHDDIDAARTVYQGLACPGGREWPLSEMATIRHRLLALAVIQRDNRLR